MGLAQVQISPCCSVRSGFSWCGPRTCRPVVPGELRAEVSHHPRGATSAAPTASVATAVAHDLTPRYATLGKSWGAKTPINAVSGPLLLVAGLLSTEAPLAPNALIGSRAIFATCLSLAVTYLDM